MESNTSARLARLLKEHGAALVLLARQWCDAPEDIVQEAFLLLARRAALPEEPVNWMYRVVRHRAISASRSAARRRRREAAVAHRGEAWFQPSPGDRLDAAATTRALEQLPIEQREAIIAHLWGGLSFEEIARLTGSSKSAVHRCYQQGLAALRERLHVPCPRTTSALTT
jgi:RNA polymerase sigma-70 factor (ECF subfamily)